VRLRRLPIPLLLALALSLGAAFDPARAEAQPNRTLEVPAAASTEWQRQLELTRQELRGLPPTSERVAQLEANLTKVVEEAAAAEAQAKTALQPLRQELAALGPPPEEGEAPELPEITEVRADIQRDIGLFESRLRQAQLAQTQARALLREISRAQQRELTDRLLETYPSPLSPGTWAEAARQGVSVLQRVVQAPLAWWQDAPPIEERPGQYVLAAAAFVLALLASWPLRLFLRDRFGRDPTIEDPSYSRRLLGVVVDSTTDALLPLLALAALTYALIGQHLLTGTFADLAQALVIWLAFFFVTAGLSRAALAPRLPAWRIVPTSRDGAVYLARRTTAVALAFTIGGLVWSGIEATTATMPMALASVVLLVAVSVLTVLMIGLLPSRFWPESARGSGYWPLLRVGMWLLLAACPVLALAGYPALGAFVLSRIALFALLVGGLMLARAILRDTLGQFLASDGRWFGLLARNAGLGEQTGRILLFWLSLALDALLILLGIYLLLNFAGVPSALLNLWALEALDEFEVGGLVVAPLDFLLAVGVFLLALAATGFVKRMLGERLLPQTRLDVGARHSIVAASGYLGVIVALLLGIGAMGLDLSNIAIIAGALSVGIGFGLREVVNNFVSGLLLLIERPIKVGDWIVTAGHEGMVKRISVRATEIETFDRASVIVPNSELITQPVTNWTHKNRVARVIVHVRVAYGSDTQLVHDLLLKCATDHPDVTETPPSYVLFTRFGDSGLEFELRAYVRDTDYFLTVGSDLHFAIERALREHGIVVPYPQRDLHLRDWPGQPPAPPGGAASTSLAPRPEPADAPTASEAPPHRSAPQGGPEGGGGGER
jgi:small-conductance mechanosensitive channel